ncbi:MAG: acetyl-CoA carboxylase biotin carboxylase subunit [Anaerolineae bacterium]
MFEKILIANRGEIAVRILRACRELGVKVVAVYSDVDRSALHVRYADEAYCIGKGPPRESYLRLGRIIDAAIRAKVDAIHPGYGFLSESSLFAQACSEANLVFIGPSPQAIRLISDAESLHRAVEAAGVSLAPVTGWDLSDEELIAAAERLSYPLLVRAVASGGGKGVRAVASPPELPSALEAARREAKAAFDDDRVYLERLMEGARHIEIQIMGDSEGHFIHLGEREGSIRRRHQQLVEEAPSPALDKKLRQEMGQAAIHIAQKIGYTNIGTVEFLLNKEGDFYFLSLSPRLQAGHPVTEMVTGIDIVKEQLRLASGRRLRYRQEDVSLRGHALECRILAEDPYRDFMPSIGRITGLYEPGGPGVRVESGIYEGFEISPYYDSLIAKLIVWGEGRAEAILRMRRALKEYRIIGVKTTIPFYQKLLNHIRFITGHFDSTFVESRLSSLLTEKNEEHLEIAAIAATLLAHRQGAAPTQKPRPTASPWKIISRWEGMEL